MKTDASGHILPFVQFGDYFYWVNPSSDDFSGSLGTIATNITIDVPPGINVLANWQANVTEAASTNSGFVRIYNPALSDFTILSNASTALFGVVANGNGGNTIRISGNGWTLTNTTSQVRAVADTTTTLTIRAIGWLDYRGRLS